MKVIETPHFKCDFCGKRQFRKCDMSLHEKWCKKNPINAHACFQHCIHLLKTEEDYDGSTYYNEDYTGKRTIFTCALTQQKMYSFIAERRKLPVLKEPGTIRMPLQCSTFKNIIDYDVEQAFGDW
jgi:hypothetical protein